MFQFLSNTTDSLPELWFSFFFFRFIKHNKKKSKQSKAEEISIIKEQTENSDLVEVANEVEEKLKTTEITDDAKKQKLPRPVFQSGRKKVLDGIEVRWIILVS